MSCIILSLLCLWLSHSARGDCNLVHTLQQCATAINNNEALSVQQDKCSPDDGCNYDCPTSKTVNSLEEKVDNILAKNITNLELKVQQILSLIQKNITNEIAKNGESIYAITDDITTAFETIDSNADDIATNKENIATNEQNITSSEENVATNEYNISAISDKVESLTNLHYHTVCGSTGWTRIAFLDMSDSTKECPAGLGLYESGGFRACGRTYSSGGSCSSITFTPHDFQYSQVCGRVIGYQYYSVDAVDHTISDQHSNIDSYYVDGASLTRGSPRQHIWTFMAAYSEQNIATYHCPCNTDSSVSLQSFIDQDYFCESANSESNVQQKLYTDDPLWDGEGCGGQEGPCCSRDNIPWFHKVFETASSDYVELRVCADQGTDNEDTAVNMYEIYVK